VTVGDAAVSLTPKEFDLLSELALNLGRPVGHKALLAAVWGDEQADIQYLRVYMGQLRQKIGAAMIRSVQGVGYELVEHAEP
jgi:two-component system, OmpR family, KDP operon response regulator KdpE